jgi:hypothetical protein
VSVVGHRTGQRHVWSVSGGPGRCGAGVSAVAVLVSVVAGVGAVCESVVVRVARPRVGRVGGGPGEPG